MSAGTEREPERPVTLREVATVVGVSKATVSLALRGSPKVHVDTRDRVRRVAEELGYRLNPAVAAGLRLVRAGMAVNYRETIAVICPDGCRPRQAGALAVLAGAREVAIRRGYRIDFFDMKAEGLSSRRLNGILRQRGITGAILACNYHSEPPLDLDWDRLSVAVVGPYLAHCRFHRVAHDGISDMRLLIEEAARRGYRRPGLVIDERTMRRTFGLAVAGFSEMRMHASPLRPVRAFIRPTIEGPAFLDWFRRERPDVIFSFTTAALNRHFLDYAIRIPEDVACVAFLTMDMKTTYTRISHDLRGVGGFALDLVVEQLQQGLFGERASPKLTLIRGQWIEGDSLPHCPGGAANRLFLRPNFNRFRSGSLEKSPSQGAT